MKTLRSLSFLLLIAGAGCADLAEEGDLDHVGEQTAALSSYPKSIKNVYSGKCLDIPWGDTRDWIAVNQHTCHGGPAQQFVIEPINLAGGVRIRNVSTNKCVMVEYLTGPPGSSNPESYRLIQGPCDRAYELFSTWVRRSSQSLTGGDGGVGEQDIERVQLEHGNNAGYCMDVPGDRWWQNSVQLQAYRPCHQGDLQKFDIRR
jgi:hypothetical protein